MLIVISPAKALDFETPSPLPARQAPAFVDRAAMLIERLRALTPQAVARLMDLSDALTALNVARYRAWQPEHTTENSAPALFAFNGDVYEGLSARTLPLDAIEWLEDHLRILSGLYGVLRPLDAMQPYRLEMGSRLENPEGKDLYAFWRTTVTEHLRAALTALAAAGEAAVLVNLASQEYFKAVDPMALGFPVITPQFEDEKGGRYQVISFYAKRARGLMVRHLAECALTEGRLQPEALLRFAKAGYHYVPEASRPDAPVFRREEKARRAGDA
ncbi:peroxide stress protein YaaA [Hydrogenophilus thiooxidans]|uniref:peroxide stress protein YaaA n=1 Tax=Hydrogenophilus thiooxidans TaxID=2820326 RepID=UPI001C237A18|nr:peroxide stress protein YaaA [Hydrogenophilus thiooxidans]